MHAILKWVFYRLLPSALAALTLALCFLILYSFRESLGQSLKNPEWHHLPFWIMGAILLVLYLLIPLLAARLMWHGEFVLLGRWISGLFSFVVFCWLFGLPFQLAVDPSTAVDNHPFSVLIMLVVWIWGCLKIASHIDRWVNKRLDSLKTRWSNGNSKSIPSNPGSGV